jgi:hypothetical protein
VKDLLAALTRRCSRAACHWACARSTSAGRSARRQSTAPEHCRAPRRLTLTAPPAHLARPHQQRACSAPPGSTPALAPAPGCTAGADAHLFARPTRWPTLLNPDLERRRSGTDRIAWPRRAKKDLSRSLRITGIENGSIIRATPEQRTAVVRVQALAHATT